MRRRVDDLEPMPISASREMIAEIVGRLVELDVDPDSLKGTRKGAAKPDGSECDGGDEKMGIERFVIMYPHLDLQRLQGLSLDTLPEPR